MLLSPPKKNWHHVFAHIDADAFFASCEQLRHPDLRHKPVCVGTQIVVAKSYAAKSFGIQTGTPVWEAKRMCPHAVFLPVDHRFYGQISQQMFANLKTFSPEIEAFSIDEAFLNLQGTLGMHHCQNYKELADKLRTQIQKKVGITVSIGISTTRLLAKLASESNKPNGSTIVSQSQIPTFLADQPVSAICGIGRAATQTLGAYGIETIPDFLKLDMLRVSKILGKPGVEIWAEMQGISVLGLQTDYKPPQSMLKTASFDKCHSDPNKLKGALLGHLDRVYNKLTHSRMLAKKIGLYFRYQNFSKECHILELDDYTNLYPEFLEKLLKLFHQHYSSIHSYRSCGVYLGTLCESRKRQYSIYTPHKIYSNHLSFAKQKIEKRYGKGSVVQGSELCQQKRKADRLKNLTVAFLQQV